VKRCESTVFEEKGAYTPLAFDRAEVKDRFRDPVGIMIGSKGALNQSSRQSVLDFCDRERLQRKHRAITNDASPHSRQASREGVKSNRTDLSLSHSPVGRPPTGQRVRTTRPQSRPPALRPGSLDPHSESVSRGVSERVSLLAVQQEWSPIKSMRWCLRGVIDGSTDVVIRAKGMNLSVGGVSLCRNPLCPWCSQKRSMESADALSKGLTRARKQGFFTRLLTLTIPTGGDYKGQRDLLSRSLRRFSKKTSKEFKKQGSQRFGLSWSFDITLKMERSWKSHLHIHAVLVSDQGYVSESTLFEWWQAAVNKESEKPVRLTRRAFYCRAPSSDKSISAYIMSKFLRSAIEVQASITKDGGKLGGGIGWREFLRYIHKTGDVAAGMLFKEILEGNRNKWWSSVGKTIKELAVEEEEQEVGDPVVERQAELVEVEIAPRDWLVLGKLASGIVALLAVVQNREIHPNRYALVREWIAKMRSSRWLTDDEVEKAWKLALEF
jgi:hypothetical protein